MVGGCRDNPYRLDGLFVESVLLLKEGLLADFEAERLKQIFSWYNANVPCPPFRASLESGAWTRDAVAWYRDDAIWAIRRMWEMAALLREHGRPTRFIQAENPGRIVYTDAYQVVAEAPV